MKTFPNQIKEYMANNNDLVLSLAREGLALIDEWPSKVAASARKALRVARLTRDYVAAFTIEYDFLDSTQNAETGRLIAKLGNLPGDVEKAYEIYKIVHERSNEERRYESVKYDTTGFHDVTWHATVSLDTLEWQ